MSDFEVARTRVFAGVWEGVVKRVTGNGEGPALDVTHAGEPVGFELAPDGDNPGVWTLRIPIPTERLSDGVQVFLITEKGSGEKLDAFTFITGEPLGDDIRAEVELLRAELDMLKRAFRRHCLETM